MEWIQKRWEASFLRSRKSICALLRTFKSVQTELWAEVRLFFELWRLEIRRPAWKILPRPSRRGPERIPWASLEVISGFDSYSNREINGGDWRRLHINWRSLVTVGRARYVQIQTHIRQFFVKVARGQGLLLHSSSRPPLHLRRFQSQWVWDAYHYGPISRDFGWPLAKPRRGGRP